jgi:starvation-inducible DNA-binding protein
MATAVRRMPRGGGTAFRTTLPLRPQLRERLVELLNGLLADAVDLQLQAKHAHWNVRGGNFLPLHELFDRVAAAAGAHADLLAERAVQLGGLAEGLLPAISDRSELAAHRPPARRDADYLRGQVHAIAVLSERLRRGILEAEALGDVVTADLLTEISRAAEKLLWQLEAHLPVEGAAR